jgi:hypothetical protein
MNAWYFGKRSRPASTSRKNAGARHAFRPRLEALEERTVPSFLPPVNYPLTGLTNYLAVADLNGDGNLDLIAPHAPVNNQGNGIGPVSILFGNSQGAFAAPVNIATGLNPNVLAVGDFNGDGKIDLAVTDQLSTTKRTEVLSILLNNGNGTFRLAHAYLSPFAPSAMLTADFTGDGRTDLALEFAGIPEVVVLPGNGDGSFGAARVSGTAAAESVDMAVGDFNGDGKPDLAVVNGSYSGSGTVSVLLGNGNGTFKAPAVYLAGDGSFAPVVGDFNGDGHPDLAITDAGNGINGGTPGVTILLNKGNGTFAAGVTYPDSTNLPFEGAMADINGDGKPDLVVSEDYAIAIFQGNGDGTFAPPTHLADTTSIGGHIQTGDFNHDGRPDVAVVGSGVTVFLQSATSNGSFHAPAVARGSAVPAADLSGFTHEGGRIDSSATQTKQGGSLAGSAMRADAGEAAQGAMAPGSARDESASQFGVADARGSLPSLVLKRGNAADSHGLGMVDSLPMDHLELLAEETGWAV